MERHYDVTINLISDNGNFNATRTFFVSIKEEDPVLEERMEDIEEAATRIGVERMMEYFFLKPGDNIAIQSVKEIVDNNEGD